MLIVTSNDFLLNAYNKAKDRGVIIRIITEVTSYNLSYLKKIFPVVNEIRYIDGLVGTFGISEKDYIITDVSPIDALSQRVIHCTITVFIQQQQQQYFFNTLWKKAIPAKQKIQEIEKGIKQAEIETITDHSEIETKYFHHLESRY